MAYILAAVVAVVIILLLMGKKKFTVQLGADDELCNRLKYGLIGTMEYALGLTENNYPPGHKYAFFTWDPKTFKIIIHYSKKYSGLPIGDTGGWVFTKSSFLAPDTNHYTIISGKFELDYLCPLYPKKSWLDPKIQSKLSQNYYIVIIDDKVYRAATHPYGKYTGKAYAIKWYRFTGPFNIPPSYVLEVNHDIIQKLPKCAPRVQHRSPAPSDIRRILFAEPQKKLFK